MSARLPGSQGQANCQPDAARRQHRRQINGRDRVRGQGLRRVPAVRQGGGRLPGTVQAGACPPANSWSAVRPRGRRYHAPVWPVVSRPASRKTGASAASQQSARPGSGRDAAPSARHWPRYQLPAASSNATAATTTSPAGTQPTCPPSSDCMGRNRLYPAPPSSSPSSEIPAAFWSSRQRSQPSGAGAGVLPAAGLSPAGGALCGAGGALPVSSSSTVRPRVRASGTSSAGSGQLPPVSPT